MSYGDEGKTQEPNGQDEIDMGAGNELPVKAHFRRTENAWLYEKRGGKKTERVLDLVTAFTKTVLRFAELNGPSHAELSYLLAEQLTYVECNPKYTSETLAMARDERDEYLTDPRSKARFSGALTKLRASMVDLQMEFGHAATYRAMASAILSLQDMPNHLRAIGPDSNGEAVSEDPRAPFDYTGKPFSGLATKQPATIFDDLNEVADRLGIKRSGGSFVDQANAKLDHANATAEPTPVGEPVRRRWCKYCETYHNV